MSSEPRSTEKDSGEETAAVARDEKAADPVAAAGATDATSRPVGAEAAPDMDQLPDDQQQLRGQIDETRAELGDTVEALSAKADVKGQVKDKVETGKAQLRGQQAKAEAKFTEVTEQAKQNPVPFAAAAAGVVALLLGAWRLRKRRQA